MASHIARREYLATLGGAIVRDRISLRGKPSGSTVAQKSRPIDPVLRADSVVLAISAEKDGNLPVVCARIGRDKVVLLGEVLKLR
jgi:hypothetical protein